MARKSRKAARGRHNKTRLHRINDALFANGVAAQPSLTKAEEPYKRLLAEKRAKEIPVVETESPSAARDSANTSHQKYLERKQKQEARKAQSEKAKKEKLARTLNNQNQKE